MMIALNLKEWLAVAVFFVLAGFLLGVLSGLSG